MEGKIKKYFLQFFGWSKLMIFLQWSTNAEIPTEIWKIIKYMATFALFFCNSLTQCVCILQYNGSAFNFYCYEVGRLSEIESVETCEKFHDAWLLVKILCKMYKSGGLSTNNISLYRTSRLLDIFATLYFLQISFWERVSGVWWFNYR